MTGSTLREPIPREEIARRVARRVTFDNRRLKEARRRNLDRRNRGLALLAPDPVVLSPWQVPLRPLLEVYLGAGLYESWAVALDAPDSLTGWHRRRPNVLSNKLSQALTRGFFNNPYDADVFAVACGVLPWEVWENWGELPVHARDLALMVGRGGKSATASMRLAAHRADRSPSAIFAGMPVPLPESCSKNVWYDVTEAYEWARRVNERRLAHLRTACRITCTHHEDEDDRLHCLTCSRVATGQVADRLTA